MKTAKPFLVKHAAVIAPSAAAVLGWLLITFGIAALWRPHVVWPLSIGLLCFSLPGLKNLRDIFGDGLYSLMLDQEESTDA